MSWTRKVNHPSEVLEKGDVVEAMVLDIDPDQQRISLGLKQLAEDPWSDIESQFQVGDTVKGEVTKVASFGAFVELENGIEGLVHISQLSDEHVKRVKDVINVGDSVEAKIVKIDMEGRRVGLSLKDEDNLSSSAGGDSSSASLRPGEDLGDMGDIFASALDTQEEKAEEAPAEEPEKTEKAEEPAVEEAKEEKVESEDAEEAESEEAVEEEKEEEEKSE